MAFVVMPNGDKMADPGKPPPKHPAGYRAYPGIPYRFHPIKARDLERRLRKVVCSGCRGL